MHATMEPQADKLNCKIIIVGDSGVGKTSIMNRFCKGSYLINTSATIGVNVDSKCLKIFDKMVNMIIWDTDGQERFNSITKAYFRYAKVAIFVYDVTRQKTLWNMEKWFNIVKEEAPSVIIKVLVGNKCDKKNFKQISVIEGKKVADYFGMVFFEVSSKENISVDSIFYSVATMFVELNRDKMLTSQRQLGVVMLTNEENKFVKKESNCFLDTIYDWFKNEVFKDLF